MKTSHIVNTLYCRAMVIFILVNATFFHFSNIHRIQQLRVHWKYISVIASVIFIIFNLELNIFVYSKILLTYTHICRYNSKMLYLIYIYTHDVSFGKMSSYVWQLGKFLLVFALLWRLDRKYGCAHLFLLFYTLFF